MQAIRPGPQRTAEANILHRVDLDPDSDLEGPTPDIPLTAEATAPTGEIHKLM